MGKVHGSLARAGKVKAATPKVSSLRFPANDTRYTIAVAIHPTSLFNDDFASRSSPRRRRRTLRVAPTSVFFTPAVSSTLPWPVASARYISNDSTHTTKHKTFCKYPRPHNTNTVNGGQKGWPGAKCRWTPTPANRLFKSLKQSPEPRSASRVLRWKPSHDHGTTTAQTNESIPDMAGTCTDDITLLRLHLNFFFAGNGWVFLEADSRKWMNTHGGLRMESCG